MADILIHGISMPRERDHLTITINADGTVQPLVDMYCPIIAHAIELPEHGDLIDRSKLSFVCGGTTPMEMDYVRRYVVDGMPAIVPSNKEDDE